MTTLAWLLRNTRVEGEREVLNRDALERMFPDWKAVSETRSVATVIVSRIPGRKAPRCHKSGVISGSTPWR